MKKISILGSTGSIGQSTLSVVEKFPDRFRVVGLAAGNNVDILEKQVRRFMPAMVSVVSPPAAESLKKRCADVNNVSIFSGVEGMIRVAAAEEAQITVSAIVGTAGLVPTMAAIRAVAAQVAPSIPLYHDETLNEALTRYLSDRILFARLLSLLSALAVCLAAVGLYGLVAYGVTSQTREIGIRIALGAQKGRVLSVAAREGVVVCGAGTAVGLVGAAAVARLLESRLYGLSPFVPASYGLAAIILGTVALIAALIPARNATRIDPMVALRAE